MWSDDFLRDVSSIAFSDSEKLNKYYDAYVRESLRPAWAIDVKKLTNVVHFRDYVEDLLKVNTSKLVAAIKSTSDPLMRSEYCLAFLHEHFLLRGYSLQDLKFVSFAIDRELAAFFDLAKSIVRFRPVLKNSRETLELILQSLKTCPSADFFVKLSKDLGHSNIWPVLALYSAHIKGEAEEYFLHCPLPRIFGGPSVIRNSIERTVNAEKLLSKSEALNIQNVVVGSASSLCYKTSSGFKVFDANARLLASLPGLTNYVWTLSNEGSILKARIYRCDDAGPVTILEFDLERPEEEPNWIDCQRDADSTLVFSWGHINSLTGSLQDRFCFALDDDFASKPIFHNDVSECEPRAVKGSKIDYRDHGNLMSIHHTVTDVEKKDRSWMHTYEMCFGNYLLMSLTTDSRPVEAVYGAAHDFVLLSPLSSTQSIQQWCLQKSKFVLQNYLSVPKSLKGDWTSVAVLYK
jgi:hypothetical protein